MADWMPMFALPNIGNQEPIEVDGLALVAASDGRVKALTQKHGQFRSYLSRFKTEFGVQVCPSVLIRDKASPERYRTVEALAAFRDAIAISVIPHSWAHLLRYENSTGIRYANWFSFYPWMVDRNFDSLMMQSIAQLGVHDVEKLQAQVTPGFPYMTLDRRMIDKPLLGALLRRWEHRFKTDSPSREDVSLFRSLNMALSASMTPGNVEVTIFDIGRAIALWVSAFEILSHPGSPNNGYRQVYKLLERPTLNLTECKEALWTPYGWKDGQPLRSLPVWLYGELNRARNDFIHGNPIEHDRLIVPPGKRHIHLYAAPLFRIALTGYLDLKMDRPPVEEGQTGYEAFRAYQHAFGGYQRDIEAALATIMLTEEEYREERQGRIQRARRPRG